MTARCRVIGVLVCGWAVLACGTEADSVAGLQPDSDGSQVISSEVVLIDVAVPDTDFVADTGEDPCSPGSGCFGEPCSATGDCLSELCVLHLGEAVCSKPCVTECPGGWSCKQVQLSGNDLTFACVSNATHLCLPCTSNADCSADPVQNACVSYGDSGAFCGSSCSEQAPCPSGFVCTDSVALGGGESRQCVPAEGECSCSTTAVDLGLSTECSASNEDGACPGVRICSAAGLSECDAVEPAEDVCNGVDDDCDGDTDEGDCDDGNPCTEDSCAGTDGCTHVNIAGPCDDQNACTVEDTCAAGICAGAAALCADEEPCTADGCDPTVGCTFAPTDAACTDDDSCTLGDHCAAGACIAGALIACDDGNSCTQDACGDGGCVFSPVDGACDDDNACTTGEACSAGACLAVAAMACADANLCTDDSCDPATGCVHTANSAPCDDGSVCTTGDVCGASLCQPGGVVFCDDSNPCTIDSCDPVEGCQSAPGDADCSDGDVCTIGDTCVGGACLPAGPLVCNDSQPCTQDVCLPQVGCSAQPASGAPCNDQSVCTLQDTCLDGVCQGAVALPCDDGQVCTTDSCDPAVGCIQTAADGPCDDANLCTSGDACQAGACIGVGAKDCDDDNPCTIDSCLTADGCTHTPAAGPCDDGAACTLNDQCSLGSCVSGAELSCDDANVCTLDTCQLGLGGGPECAYLPVSGVCDDGNSCTAADLCFAGTCEGASPIGCEDGEVCTIDWCVPGTGCQQSHAAWACEDGDPCTIADVCAGGVCTSGPTPGCDDGNPCTDDSCGGGPGGLCQHVANTQPCDDGSACTTDDACAESTCSGAPIGCDDLDVCTLDGCSAATGCTTAPASGPCEDGDPCTVGDVCAANGCTPGALQACDDLNACTDDNCDSEGLCVHAPNDLACDDASACTALDTCTAGVCLGTATTCDDGNTCTADGCDPATGCTTADKTGPCDDGAPCTVGDACSDGLCVAGTLQTCDDGNPCTSDICDAAGQCAHGFAGGLCDDGSACTAADACAAGQCVGTPIGCDDGQSCTLDGCDPNAGCTHDALDGPCDDGEPCTIGDTCAGGVCVAGTAQSCDDGNACTDDLCDAAGACTHSANAGTCDDGSACTEADGCLGGSCVGVAVVCDDNNPCTGDLCDPSAGCIHAAADVSCQDGNPCTVGDTCVEGVCASGAVQTCDDGNICTDDSCASGGLCEHQANTASCSDGSACTSAAACLAGACVGTPVVCDDSNPCTADGCDPAAGCTATPAAGACSDGDPCTVGDACSAGVCVPGPAPSCDDGNPCTNDACAAGGQCAHVANVLPCDDGDACTSGDLCAGGVCLSDPAGCDDSNDCTQDICEPSVGCAHANFAGPCDDGDVCTVSDQCTGGICVAGAPAVLPDAGPVQGDASVCADATDVIWSVVPVAGAATYTWTLPDGAVITAGQGGSEVTATMGTTAGSVQVTASGACGSGAASTLSVAVVAIPGAPVSITGPGTVCSGQGGLGWSVAADPTASSYSWTLPAGSAITAGDTTSAITVTSGSTSGDVGVSASNQCGSSAARLLSVTVESCLEAGLIVAWSGAVSLIPAGWSLCDGTNGTPDLRGRFPRGPDAGLQPGDSGGSAATHDHGGTSVTLMQTGSTSPGGRSCGGNSCTWKTGNASHSHSFDHSHTMVSTVISPPYADVLYLRNDTATSLPAGAILQWGGLLADVPAGFTPADGSSGSPDLTDRFLRGAPAGEGSGASGGATTHDHLGVTGEWKDTGSYDHNLSTVGCFGASATDGSHKHEYAHSHSVGAASHEPPHVVVAHLFAASTAAPASGVIALWSGSLATIPSGWQLCDGTSGTLDLRDRFAKGSSAGGEPGAAGGALDHTHGIGTDPGGTTSLSTGGNGGCSDGGQYMAFHTHSVGSHDHSTSAVSNIPLWTGLAWIQRL